MHENGQGEVLSLLNSLIWVNWCKVTVFCLAFFLKKDNQWLLLEKLANMFLEVNRLLNTTVKGSN